jgi:hypothetical protein
MILLEKILEQIDESAKIEIERRKEHKNKVIKAVKWFIKYSEPSKLEGFVYNRISYKRKGCVCTNVNLEYPFAEFTLRPQNIIDNIGNGAGMGKTITF